MTIIEGGLSLHSVSGARKPVKTETKLDKETMVSLEYSELKDTDVKRIKNKYSLLKKINFVSSGVSLRDLEVARSKLSDIKSLIKEDSKSAMVAQNNVDSENVFKILSEK